MKLIKYTTVIISFILSVGLSAQGLRDTLICADTPTGNSIKAPYDTLTYASEWFYIGESQSFSLEGSVIVMDLDTIVVIGTASNPALSIINDTIAVALRVTPIVELDYPLPQCYNGDSIVISDNSTVYGPYTNVTYTDNLGTSFNTFNPTLNWFVSNGDSAIITSNYSIPDCQISIDTTFTIATFFSPVSNFNTQESCFGERTIINNDSDFNRNISTFSLEVEGVETFNDVLDTYQFLIPENGTERNVYVEISQDGCVTRDTFIVSTLITPTADFNFEKTCENELLEINNLSTDVTLNSTYTFNISGNVFPYNSETIFTIPDMFPDGNYNIASIVDNGNGCKDTLELEVEIDMVTYVNYQNLEMTYCQFEESDILIASVSGGNFTGQFINDFNNGSAVFLPTDTGSNIPITYTYTNDLLCTDSYTETVDTIYPKPMIILSGLDSTYCELDSASELSINQTITDNSRYEILKNGQLFDSENSLNYEFDPIEAGAYEIINTYSNLDGCLDTLLSNTTVNSNPNVSVDSLIVLIPGESIIIGNNSAPEPNVEYIWSNSSNSSNIEISEPGIYIISAENIITGCMTSDTATVQYDATIETEVINIEINPNPTQSSITLTLDQQKQGIRIIDVYGLPVTINGQSEFNTDANGILNIDLTNQVSGYYYLLIPDIGNFLLLKI